MSSEDISTLSNEIKTLISSVVDLKNEVEDLKEKNKVLLELKNDIKEIKNLLLSSSKNDQLKSTIPSVEILKNKTSESEIETTEKETTSTLINDSNHDNTDSDSHKEETIDNTNNHDISNNNSNDINNKEINENTDNNIITDNSDNNSKDNEINNNNSNECNSDHDTNNNELKNQNNQDILTTGINETNLIYDQRIMYLTNYFYGSIWNEKKENILQSGQSTGSFSFNQYSSNSHSYNSLGNYKTTFYNDAIKVVEDCKKLFCLYIEQKDLSNVIKASYRRMDIDSKVVQNLIDKFILIKDKIKRTREILKSNYSSETVDINYRNKYKTLLDKFKEEAKKELSENKYNFIIDKLNILRLRQLNYNVSYLLSEKDVDNTFKIYDIIEDEFKSIIDELIKSYNDHIYDNEFQINGRYSLHLNKSSFYLLND